MTALQLPRRTVAPNFHLPSSTLANNSTQALSSGQRSVFPISYMDLLVRGRDGPFIPLWHGPRFDFAGEIVWILGLGLVAGLNSSILGERPQLHKVN